VPQGAYFGKPKRVIAAMYLDKILGSKTKVNLLSVLIACPERSIVENELAKEAGCRFLRSIGK